MFWMLVIVFSPVC